MSTTGTPTPNSNLDTREVADVVCLGCGCLCDDLILHIDNGRVASLSPSCPLGLSWFQRFGSLPRSAGSRIDGREVSLDEAITEAAERLLRARAPLVLGLTGTTIEAQREAVAIADAIGAVVELAHAADSEPVVAAFQNIGSVGATLGEVKNRADVIVYWDVDPSKTHPRHEERYAVAPAGRFVPNGRDGRYVIVVADPSAEVLTPADSLIRISKQSQPAALRVLSALSRGKTLCAAEVEVACGVPLESLEELATRMKEARYGAFFYGSSLGRDGGASTVESALRLVRDLNAGTRFVALPMGGSGNPAGAEAVLTWQTGFPHTVDLGSGVPRFRPGEALIDSRLQNYLCDAVLLVGWGAMEGIPAASMEIMRRLPVVEIAPGATLGVAIDAASPGIAAGGTVMRCDGVTLPLCPIIREPDQLNEAATLRRVREAILAREATR